MEMTSKEFLEWDPDDGRPWQLIDGEPVAMAPTKTTHSRIEGNLSFLITAHLRAQDGPCDLLVSPGIIPRADARHNVRIPDLAVTCTPAGAEEEATLDEPILIVEILSPINQAETWSNVWTFTTIPTVREILVVRSARQGVALLRRLADGTWPAERSEVDSGTITLESIGLTMSLDEIYRRTRLARGVPGR